MLEDGVNGAWLRQGIRIVLVQGYCAEANERMIVPRVCRLSRVSSISRSGGWESVEK